MSAALAQAAPALPAGAISGPGAGLPAGATLAQPPLPHDIRGLMPYVAGPLAYILWAVAAVAVVAGAVLAWRWWKKKKRVVPPVDPWDALTARLAALSVEPGPAFGRKAQEELFYQLSLLLREGIEMRTSMQIRATDLTLRELAVQIKAHLPLPRGDGEEMLALLERADMVKFAAAPATPEEALAAKTRVAQWVERLRPLPDVTAAPAAPGAAGAKGEAAHALR